MTSRLKLRPEVDCFAQLMEAKLRENDHKGRRGWKKDDSLILLSRACEEMGELFDSFKTKWAGKRNGPAHGLLLAEQYMYSACDVLRRYQPTMTSTAAAPGETTVGEVVDVANFLMMVVDVLGGLK
jgi:hypothetical protein